MLLIVPLNHGVRTRCEQMMSLKTYCKLMRTSKFSLAKCSWCGPETTVCMQTWLFIINRDHTHDHAWHYDVESFILDVKRDIATMLATLHEVN